MSITSATSALCGPSVLGIAPFYAGSILPGSTSCLRTKKRRRSRLVLATDPENHFYRVFALRSAVLWNGNSPSGVGLDKGRFPTSNDGSKHAVSPPGDRLDDNSPGKRSNCSSGSGYEDKQHFEPIYRATDKYGSTGSPTGRPEDLIDGLVPDNQLKSPKGKTPGKGDSTGRPAGLPVVSSAGNVLDSQDIPYSRHTPVLKAGHQYVAIPSEYGSVYSSDPTGHVLNSSIANVSVGSSTGLNVPNPPGLNLRHTMTTDQNMIQDGRGMSRLPRNPG